MTHYKIYQTCGPMHHMSSMCKTWLAHPRRDRGNLSLLILQALEEQPLHGYGIIKAIEEKRGYAPDPSSLYPTLQLLQDQGCVEIDEKEKKTVCESTECRKASDNLSGTRFPESANELHRSPVPFFELQLP